MLPQPTDKPIITGNPNDDDKWWLALLSLGATDYDNADAYWRSHASPMFAGLISRRGIPKQNADRFPDSPKPDFSYDPSTQRYVRSNGRAVKDDELRALMLAFLASAADEMEQDAGRMARGELPIDEWQAKQSQTIKNLYIASYAAGRGGLSSITPDDTEEIIGAKSGNGLAGTFKKLRRFGKQIDAEKDTAETVPQIVNRAGLYAGPAHTQFEAGKRAVRKGVKDEDGESIQWEERNILDDQADHCKTEEYTDGCPEVTDMGWQPMGTLPLPGLRTCGPSCRCHMNYRPIEKKEPLAMSEASGALMDVHKPALDRAHAAADSGKVDHGDWAAPSQSDRKQEDCLGPDKSYPVFKDGKLSKNALANAESRAVQNGHPEIANHAKKLLEKIDNKKMATSAEPLTGLILKIDYGSEFVPTLTLGQTAPKDDGGNRFYDYWKEVLKPGKLHDSKGRDWDIKPNDIDEAVTDGERALSLGFEPLIQDDHFKPTTSYGTIKGFRKNSNGALEWLHRFSKRDGRSAEENRDKALAKKISPMLIPDFTDARDRKFKWWPEHSASIFRPQQKDLQDFTPALAASDGQAVNAVYLTLADGEIPMLDLKPLRDILGEKAKDQPDDKVLALSTELFIENRTKLTDQIDANKLLVVELKKAEGERDTAKALALSAAEDEPTDPKLIAMGAKVASRDVALALSGGQITKKQSEYLLEQLKTKPALSLSADENTASPIEDLLAFAKLGADDPKSGKGAVRGVPAIPLALGEDEEDKSLTPERRAYLMGQAGYHTTAQKTA